MQYFGFVNNRQALLKCLVVAASPPGGKAWIVWMR